MEKILDYKIIKIKFEASKFLQDRIKLTTALSTLLKKQRDFTLGNYYTFFPAYVTLPNPIDLDEGGFLKVSDETLIAPVPNTSDGLVAYIYQYLKKDKKNIVLAEHFYARPTDINDAMKKVVVADENIYRLLTHTDTKEAIAHVIKACSSFPEAIGILSSYDDIESFKNKNILEKDILIQAVENMKSLYVEAFDHESYLIWESN